MCSPRRRERPQRKHDRLPATAHGTGGEREALRPAVDIAAAEVDRPNGNWVGHDGRGRPVGRKDIIRIGVPWHTGSRVRLIVVHNALQFLDVWDALVTMACETGGGVERSKKDCEGRAIRSGGGVTPGEHPVHIMYTARGVFLLPHE